MSHLPRAEDDMGTTTCDQREFELAIEAFCTVLRRVDAESRVQHHFDSAPSSIQVLLPTCCLVGLKPPTCWQFLRGLFAPRIPVRVNDGREHDVAPLNDELKDLVEILILSVVLVQARIVNPDGKLMVCRHGRVWSLAQIVECRYDQLALVIIAVVRMSIPAVVGRSRKSRTQPFVRDKNCVCIQRAEIRQRKSCARQGARLLDVACPVSRCWRGAAVKKRTQGKFATDRSRSCLLMLQAASTASARCHCDGQ